MDQDWRRSHIVPPRSLDTSPRARILSTPDNQGQTAAPGALSSPKPEDCRSTAMALT